MPAQPLLGGTDQLEDRGVTEERGADEGRERPSTAADRRGRRSGPAHTAAGKGRATSVREARPEKKDSLPGRVARFLREVVAELRKVIWPTRKQLVTYTIVVLIFVSFMIALVALMDFVFGQGVLFLFGN
jgi:preprotein translocase subunit SecE